MNLQLNDIKSKLCLYGFRCGINELERFSKIAFREHSKERPDYRVRCLYDASDPKGSALGYYSLSIKIPSAGQIPVGNNTIYSGDRAFLYIDHFAVRAERQAQGLSTWLMVDLLSTANDILARTGRLDYLSLNAADEKALTFFRDKWQFTPATEDTYPFLVRDRLNVFKSVDEIARLSAAED